MTLSSLNFKTEYRSGRDDLVGELYRPALALASQYWRAVGYFSSSALDAIGQPLGEFIYRGGLMRLVTSVELQQQDLEAIEQGLAKQTVCEQRLLEQIRSEFADPAATGVARLSSLLESGRLELRIALPSTGRGIYHEKVGVFIDGEDYVAFFGSSNESRTALEANYECVDVYCSWAEPKRAMAKKRHFELLWENKATGVISFPFPEAAKRELIKVCRPAGREPHRERKPLDDKWRHQEEAVGAFLSCRRGVLEMATGTGKTHTALQILRRLIEAGEVNSVIVAAEGTDLLDQWSKQLFVSSSSLTPRFRLLRHFGVHHQRDEYELSPENSVLVASRPALHELFRRLRPSAKRRMLLIHDEVHGLGSEQNVRALEGLSDDVPFRLGLSATPDREYDDEGTAFIERHIGPVIYRFPLEEAIRRGILCEFDYVPLEYELSDEDRGRLQAVYRQRAARAALGNPMSEAEVWTALARVHKTSLEKLPLFEKYLSEHPEILKRSIIFVAEKEYGDKVLSTIHRYRYDYHTYYADDERSKLVEFARGDISSLITCHRVSEGIDVRSIRSIILLASDRARLETIQRIGRCLRTDPEDPSKRAFVLDFVRAQDKDDGEPNADQVRMSWLTSLSDVRREVGRWR